MEPLTLQDLKVLESLFIIEMHSSQHYLLTHFPYRPALVDKNRRLRGDYYVKPTMYFFIGCEPTHGESRTRPKECKTVQHSSPGIKAGICSEERSLISPDYARNFICDFILGKEQKHTMLTLF